MASYVTIGANDIPASERFYTAILAPLGYEKTVAADSVAYALPDIPGRYPGPAAIYVRKPYDGQLATVGNGSMIAFSTESHEAVRRLHAAGMSAGGSDEGAPGFRAEYSARFYVGYLRDPLGNKIAIFCNNPNEPARE